MQRKRTAPKRTAKRPSPPPLATPLHDDARKALADDFMATFHDGLATYLRRLGYHAEQLGVWQGGPFPGVLTGTPADLLGGRSLIEKVLDYLVAVHGFTDAQACRLPPEQVLEILEADATVMPATPNDLITSTAAVGRYSVSRSTLKRKVKAGELRDYRPPNSPKNAKLLLSRAECDSRFPRKK